MALDTLPPWLNVQPHDFLNAASSGLQTGLHIADMQNMASERAASREAEAQRQSDAHALAIWEMQNRMQMERERAAAEMEQQKATQDALAQYRSGELELGRGRLADSQKYHEGLVASKGEIESRKQAAQQAFAKAYQDNMAKGNVKPGEAYQAALLQSPDLLSATTLQGAFGAKERPDPQQAFGKLMAGRAYGALAAAEKAYRAAMPGSLDRDEAAKDIKRATEAYSQYAGMATNAPSAATGSAQEVTRLTKDGRQAIFDASTKKFLRFADEMSDEANNIPSTAGQLDTTDELDQEE